MKVKGFANSLDSIGALVDDEDLVAVTLNGLGINMHNFRHPLDSMRPFLIFKNYVDFTYCKIHLVASICGFL